MAEVRHPQLPLPRGRGQIGWKSKTQLGFGILNPLSRGKKGQIGWKSKTLLGFGILNSLSHWKKGQIGWKSKNG